MPYTIWNGLNPMLLFGESLYGNLACASAWSHCFGWSLTKFLSTFPKLLLVTSIYPSIFGWYVELNPKFVPIFFHNVLQKFPTNVVSLSEIMLLGNPCNLTTSLKNWLETCVASLVFKKGMKCAIFENMSTITRIESWPIWVLGNPKTKSILTASQGLLGMGNGWYNPTFWLHPLAYWQTLHFSTYFLTYVLMPGQ